MKPKIIFRREICQNDMSDIFEIAQIETGDCVLTMQNKNGQEISTLITEHDLKLLTDSLFHQETDNKRNP